jgi:hypothetical protein
MVVSDGSDGLLLGAGGLFVTRRPRHAVASC